MAPAKPPAQDEDEVEGDEAFEEEEGGEQQEEEGEQGAGEDAAEAASEEALVPAPAPVRRPRQCDNPPTRPADARGKQQEANEMARAHAYKMAQLEQLACFSSRCTSVSAIGGAELGGGTLLTAGWASCAAFTCARALATASVSQG